MLLKDVFALQGLKSSENIDFDWICLKSIGFALQVILFRKGLSIKFFFLVSNKSKNKNQWQKLNLITSWTPLFL